MVKTIQDILFWLAALKNRFMFWDLRGMTDDEAKIAISDLETEFENLLEKRFD